MSTRDFAHVLAEHHYAAGNISPDDKVGWLKCSCGWGKDATPPVCADLALSIWESIHLAEHLTAAQPSDTGLEATVARIADGIDFLAADWTTTVERIGPSKNVHPYDAGTRDAIRLCLDDLGSLRALVGDETPGTGEHA